MLAYITAVGCWTDREHVLSKRRDPGPLLGHRSPISNSARKRVQTPAFVDDRSN